MPATWLCVCMGTYVCARVISRDISVGTQLQWTIESICNELFKNCFGSFRSRNLVLAIVIYSTPKSVIAVQER